MISGILNIKKEAGFTSHDFASVATALLAAIYKLLIFIFNSPFITAL